MTQSISKDVADTKRLGIASFAVFIILFVFYYLYNKKLQLITFDITSMFLMLDDWLSGNIFLNGWIVGAESFIFTDTIWCLPLKVLGVPVVEIAYINGAIEHAGFVAVTLYLLLSDGIKRKVINSKGSIVIAGALYVFLIGTVPCIGGYQDSASYVYLNINQHSGAYLLIAIELLLMYLWRERGYRNVIIPIVFNVTGILGLMSDTFPLLILYAPLVVYSVYFIVWPKVERNNRVYIFYIASSVFITVTSTLINRMVAALGGMQMTGVGFEQSQISILTKTICYIKKLLILFGVDTSAGIKMSPYLVLVCFVLIFIGASIVYQSIKALRSNPDRIGLLLSIAIVGNILGCLVVSTQSAIWGRYLLSIPFFGFFLVIKSFNDLCSKYNEKSRVKVLTGVLLAVIVFSYAGKNVIDFIKAPNYGRDFRQVALYIQENNLGTGYAGAWISYPTSAYINFDTMLLPVFWYENTGGFYRWKSLVNTTWYEATDINYIVVFNDPFDEFACDSRKDQFYSFAGEPSDSVVIGAYEIMFYEHDLSSHLLM